MSAAPPSSRTHANAVMARLNGVQGLPTFLGAAPAGQTTPYAVIDFNSTVVPGSLADRWSQLDGYVAVRAIGTTAEQSMWAADRVRTLLLTDTVLGVAGRTSMPITQDTQTPTFRDDEVSPPLYVTTTVYRWITT